MSFTLVGVAHLLALPAGPRESVGFGPARLRALHDASVLCDAGFDAIILENFGDSPFTSGTVDPHVVAFVAILAAQIRERHPKLRIGINLLRNDARSAMGVAAAAGADFIRVNVHSGAMVTDQGILQGDAHGTLRYRRELCGHEPPGRWVEVAADVLVKHAVPLGDVEIGAVAADTARRGGAGILIVTGEGTGKPADPERVRRVREAVPEVPVWLGSGVTAQTLPMWSQLAHGAIIGTALHEDGDLRLPLSLKRAIRVRELAGA
ncbi:MAG: BtpA/SgcQ family protein [Myxococcales bacterium]|nr:BtpA/SgcQ family protein [Myxococcales bacterium]